MSNVKKFEHFSGLEYENLFGEPESTIDNDKLKAFAPNLFKYLTQSRMISNITRYMILNNERKNILLELHDKELQIEYIKGFIENGLYKINIIDNVINVILRDVK